VIGLSMLLLTAVFRSLLIPLKAAVLNLLSLGASLGVITAAFQHGVLGALIGVEPGPVEVRTSDDLRDRLRPVDGLRGLPAVAHA
jgi:RND superfamily putative drug exporter